MERSRRGDAILPGEVGRDLGRNIGPAMFQNSLGIPRVMTNIAMENGPFIDGLPINSMVIFHVYVK